MNEFCVPVSFIDRDVQVASVAGGVQVVDLESTR